MGPPLGTKPCGANRCCCCCAAEPMGVETGELLIVACVDEAEPTEGGCGGCCCEGVPPVEDAVSMPEGRFVRSFSSRRHFALRFENQT